jgi:hypothetical protein
MDPMFQLLDRLARPVPRVLGYVWGDANLDKVVNTKRGCRAPTLAALAIHDTAQELGGDDPVHAQHFFNKPANVIASLERAPDGWIAIGLCLISKNQQPVASRTRVKTRH